MEKKIIKKEEVKVAEPKATVSSYSVYDTNGVLVRTYTKEEGNDFAKKAEQFAEKKGYIIK